jgi:hypothetical protein
MDQTRVGLSTRPSRMAVAQSIASSRLLPWTPAQAQDKAMAEQVRQMAQRLERQSLGRRGPVDQKGDRFEITAGKIDVVGFFD